jgi:hypothetical protein
VAKLEVVVDLAVHGDELRAILVPDGLTASFEVDDRQSPEDEPVKPIVKVRTFVGAAGRNALPHTLEECTTFRNARALRKIEKAGETAHVGA